MTSFEVWRTVLDCLSLEAQYRPPQRALRRIKAAHVQQKSWRWLIEIARWAEPVFDSLRQPAPALVRGAIPSTRKLVHRAEPFVIDLTLEPDPIRNRILVVGQILNSEYPDEPMRGLDVVLLRGEQFTGKAKTSNSGEFEIECERDNNLRLFINIPGQRAIGIALPNVEI